MSAKRVGILALSRFFFIIFKVFRSPCKTLVKHEVSELLGAFRLLVGRSWRPFGLSVRFSMVLLGVLWDALGAFFA